MRLVAGLKIEEYKKSFLFYLTPYVNDLDLPSFPYISLDTF